MLPKLACTAAALVVAAVGCTSRETQTDRPPVPVSSAPARPSAPAEQPSAPTQPSAADEPVPVPDIRASALWRVCHANVRGCFPEISRAQHIPELIDLDWDRTSIQLWSVRSDGTALAGYWFQPHSEDIHGAGPRPPPLRPLLKRLAIGKPSPISDASPLEQFAYTCSIDAAHVLVCAGKRWEGRFIDVAAGAWQACGIRDDGSLRCDLPWIDERPAPAGRFQQVGVGDEHACALDLEGAAVCWAIPAHFIPEPAPLRMLTSPTTRFVELAVGAKHSCGLTQHQRIECWGENDNGELNTPARKFQHVAARGYRTCALQVNGRVVCWDRNF